MNVHLVVPAGFAERPSGGNVYDRHLRRGLVARGWDVVVHEAGPSSTVRIPDGLVLLDSLVASWDPDAWTGHDRVVPLVHMLFDLPAELLTAAPAVVATSTWTAGELARAGVDPRRVHVAVPGVDRAGLARGTASGAALSCVANLTAAKGQDVLLRALAQLTDLDWECTLVGTTEVDPGYVDELHKLAADAGITDRVHVVGEVSDPARAWAGTDLAVLPTRSESYGMVVTEALARGLPVIASAVGGVPEALGEVRGARPGMLVRPDDPAALARSLRRWLEDAALRRWLRSVVLERRSTLPTWPATAGAVAAALEDAG